MIPSKEEIRAGIQRRLKTLSKDVFDNKGAEAAARLWAWNDWGAYRSVLVFLSTAFEINTQPLLDLAFIDRKRVFAPRIEQSSLAFFRINPPAPGERPGPRTEGAFGIREPPPDLPLAAEDFPALVITPGLAFDRRGGRLGRGRGFYDRFFAALESGALPGLPAGPAFTACGLCLELQITQTVPMESHDRKMDMILTEKTHLRP
ncbi:MAG: 5-formyltetrahydrofolate cyclo-ligase [Treponema sp.]|jgi:5-formyltetrahydrofolate cyclo-ligase|nr:5-formyltetrahydrofolate cyclo-ligase [Treponema sp.]